MMLNVLLLVCLVSIIIPFTTAAKRAYTVATYEHARYGKLNDIPNEVKKINLAKYVKAGAVAGLKGADIIIYPEYGLFYPGGREQIKNYLEYIPNPKHFQVNPCEEAEFYSDRPIILTLSCIAKDNSITVVANMGDIQDCTNEFDCPEDGAFHYNTNVVFDKNGILILKKYKEYLFLEFGMDVPKPQEYPVFDTDFGTFGTFICFDILFERMSKVAKWPEVDGIMFSTQWIESSPQYSSIQLWEGWALSNNITIAVSNLQLPGLFSVGSGIFHGQHGAIEYTYSPDGISKLVIAEVPISGKPDPLKQSIVAIEDENIWNWEEDGESVPKVCSTNFLNMTDNWLTDFRCFDDITTNYTLVKLNSSIGYAEACSRGMCCSVNYIAENMMEEFYLGVLNGSYEAENNRYSWCEESCFLARCDEVKGIPCTTFPRRANTVFYHIELSSNFSTQYIYPSVISSKVRLIPKSEWEFNTVRVDKTTYESTFLFNNDAGTEIITAGYKARCYQRDPPYVR